MQACFSAPALAPGCKTKSLGLVMVAGVSLLDIVFPFPVPTHKLSRYLLPCEMISRFKVVLLSHHLHT